MVVRKKKKTGRNYPELHKVEFKRTYYIKADMIPDVLPRVSCIPVAVVLLPYRGVLFGNCLDLLDCCLCGYS